MAHLDQNLGKNWADAVDTALVIGAGGAGRAIVAGLQERGLGHVLVANRTLSKAEELVADLDDDGPSILQALPWDRIDAALCQADLIVNTTSLGLTGQPPLDLDLGKTPDTAVVADVVYVPLRTPLLAAAEARGLRMVDGLGMLLHQAAPGFARWFGVTPEVTPALRALIVADIEQSA
jgi:shikimate dehydrogenase